MTTTYKEYPELTTIELTFDGNITEKDIDTLIPKVEAFIVKHGKVKLLEIMKNIENFDWNVLGKGIEFDKKHLADFSHCAIVTDNGWIGPVARLASAFVGIKMKAFKIDEESKARDWLKRG